MKKAIKTAAGKRLFLSMLVLILIFSQVTECFAVRVVTTIETYPLITKEVTFVQDMWYDDGFWVINSGTSYETTVTDQQISSAINLKGYLRTHDVMLQQKLPNEATNALSFGDNVVCSIESAGTLSLSELFEEGSLSYTIENGYLNIHGNPLLSFANIELSHYASGVGANIPIVDYNYGFNLFAVYLYASRKYSFVANVKGACDTSSSNDYQINQYFHPSFIKNSLGQIKDRCTIKKNETTTFRTQSHYIGKGTFPKGKTVGCEFVYPLKLTFNAEHSVTRYYYDEPVVPDPPAVDPPEEPTPPDTPDEPDDTDEPDDPNKEGETTQSAVSPLWRIHRIRKYPDDLE